MQVYPRPGGPLWSDKGLMQPLPALAPVEHTPTAPKVEMNGAAKHATGPVMKVLYGSNSGASRWDSGLEPLPWPRSGLCQSGRGRGGAQRLSDLALLAAPF